MQQSLLMKLGSIGLLSALLLVPLLMIGGIVDERQIMREQVLEDIASSSSRQQQLAGPLLVVPYKRTVEVWRTHEQLGTRYREEKEVQGRLYFLPEQLSLQGDMTTELRKRGIYEARLFHINSHLQGHFVVPERFGIGEDFDSYRFQPAFVSMGISDIRGIKNNLKLTWNKELISFAPGSQEPMLGGGVHAPLALLDSAHEQQFDFSFDLELLGSSDFSVVPMGRETQISLRSDWVHPSFFGNLLPAAREVNAEGFSANWKTSFFANNIPEMISACNERVGCSGFSSAAFGVSFVDPVDQYLKTDRSIKYAFLVIGLSFAAFFLFEVLKSLAVHPVQYGLVGLALAMFYLLLVSLTEHMSFALAYGISALACVLLLGIYLSFVLRSAGLGAGFAGSLAALYGLLYAVLSAEDYALLMGAALVFMLLAVVMLLTRKLDWYALTSKQGNKSNTEAWQ